jgi:predicted ATPase
MTDRVGGNLPVGMTRFFGRQTELAGLRRLVGTSRLVTLTGVGGVGKSRLALQAAQSFTGAFPDGTWLVELSWQRNHDLLAHLVAESLQVTDQTVRPMMEVVLEFLASRQLLLILDGAEHIREGCAELARAVLRAAPEVRIVVTSREPLNVPGEQILVVHPLPVPGSPEGDPEWCESVALFADRAEAVVPGFALTDANQTEVARLCRRVDGLPLAIELAAAQLRDLSIRQIADRLDDRLGLLASPHVGGLPRHQAMRAAIGWSHELCEPAERLMWARLSVFHGDFTLGAAQEICSDGHLDAGAITKILGSLVTKSVMERLDTAAGPRFRMLDTVREYGVEWLGRLYGEEADRLRRRYRDYYLRLAEAGERDWFSPYQADTFRRTQAEYANLRAAVEFSLTTPGEAQTGLRLAGTLWFYWVGCGHLGAGRQLLDRALALDPEPTPARAKALWVNGYIADLQGDYSRAIRMLKECKAQAMLTGNATATAYAVHRIGCAALLQDQHARAEHLFTDALDRYAALGEMNSNVIMCHVEQAMAIAFLGDLGRAFALCERVRRICGEHGERWACSYAQYVLSQAQRLSGDVRRATMLATNSLLTCHAFHDLLGMANSVELLALFAAEQGHAEQAAKLQGGASMLWQSVGPQLFGSAFFGAPHLECEALARKILGDAAYEAAFQAGRGLSPDETVSCAVGARQPG